MENHRRVGDADLLDGPAPGKPRHNRQEYSSENDDEYREPGPRGVDQRRDTRQHGRPQPAVALGVAVDVREQVLVHELGPDLVAGLLLAAAPEEDAAEHAVAIEPVGVALQVLVGEGVAAVADVFAAGEFPGNSALERAGRQAEGRVNGSKVAGKVAVEKAVLVDLSLSGRVNAITTSHHR